MVYRTWCDCLQECRDILKASTNTNSGDILLSLMEELQVYGNRMETSLYHQRDIHELYRKQKQLKKEITSLKQARKDLGGKEKSAPTREDMLDRLSSLTEDEL